MAIRLLHANERRANSVAHMDLTPEPWREGSTPPSEKGVPGPRGDRGAPEVGEKRRKKKKKTKKKKYKKKRNKKKKDKKK